MLTNASGRIFLVELQNDLLDWFNAAWWDVNTHVSLNTSSTCIVLPASDCRAFSRYHKALCTYGPGSMLAKHGLRYCNATSNTPWNTCLQLWARQPRRSTQTLWNENKKTYTFGWKLEENLVKFVFGSLPDLRKCVWQPVGLLEAIRSCRK